MNLYGLSRKIFEKGNRRFELDIRAPSGTSKNEGFELGLDEVDLNKELYTIGSKYIIPKGEIGKINAYRNKAEALVKRYGMNFKSAGWIVPKQNVQPLREGLESLKEKFFEAVEDLGVRYENGLKHEMIQKWREELVLKMSKMNITDESWFLGAMLRIEDSFGTWEKIRAKFRFEIYEDDGFDRLIEEGVKQNTQDMILKFAEYAKVIKQKLVEANLKSNSLAAAQNYLKELLPKKDMFENPELDRVFEELEEWTYSHHAEYRGEQHKAELLSAMDKVIQVAANQIDTIANRSVSSVLSFEREID